MPSTNAYTVRVVGAAVDVVERIDSIIRTAPGTLLARWLPATHADAQLLIIDTESLHGHMDWLKAGSTQRLAVACTDAPDSIDSEYVLAKPIEAPALVAILNRVGARLLEGTAAATPATSPDASASGLIGDAAATERRIESGTATLADLLTALSSPTRLASGALPRVILDPRLRVWYCKDGLKAVAGWCRRTLDPDDLLALDDAEFANAVGALPGHPYSRLRWILELSRHAGTLAPGLDPASRYRLSRWPQSEREFPRHFRIATVMLRQPATPDEIAAQSGAPCSDVNDFINAYHAIGYIEHQAVGPPATEPARTGLFARMRKAAAN